VLPRYCRSLRDATRPRATPVLGVITGLDAFHVLAITIESNIGNALHMQLLEDSGESLAHTVLRHLINTF